MCKSIPAHFHFLRGSGIVLLLSLLPGALHSVQIGQSRAAVIQEKGEPKSQMSTGSIVVLTYADQVIKLKNDKVVSIKPTEAPSGSQPTPAPAPAPLPKPVPVRPTHAAKADFSYLWTTDLEAAKAKAASEKKKVLILFTGSDWCGWCQRLQAEILQQPEFQVYAQESLVLVEIDFPKHKPIDPAVKKQNEQIARRYRIEGYPTLVVLDDRGAKVATLGYQEGGPKPLVEKLKRL